MIRNAITKYKSKSVLLSNENDLIKLDDAQADKKDEKLFSNVVDFIVLSTNLSEKQIGKWLKIDDESYEFIFSSNKTILFKLENQLFNCVSNDDICKEVE